MNSAACILILDAPRTHVLAVSRKHDKSDWGIPGGHAEPFDSDLHTTAARELREETGIIVDARTLTPIFTSPARSSICTTFMLTSYPQVWPPKLRSRPFEGYVQWQPWQVLVAPSATFKDYNEQMLRHLGMLRP